MSTTPGNFSADCSICCVGTSTVPPELSSDPSENNQENSNDKSRTPNKEDVK